MGDIEVDPNPNEEFKVPKKPLKRKMSEGERMETESVESSGVESSASDILPKLTKPAFPPIKREKLSDGTEVRKVPVPQPQIHAFEGKLDENIRANCSASQTSDQIQLKNAKC